MDISGGYDSGSFIAGYYDLIPHHQQRGDVRFYTEAALKMGGPVLEVGCGTGRVLLDTARAGVEIVGLDASTEMLRICRREVQKESESVRALVELALADMRDFDLSRRFRLITIPFRPFQHLLTVADQEACLACLYRHLEGEGQLILDVFDPSLKLLTADNLGEEQSEGTEITLPDGTCVDRWCRTVTRDYAAQVIHVELIYYVTHPDGRKERLVHAFPMRYLFRYELEHLLWRCGFELEQLYADFDESPYGTRHPCELIAVARRRESALAAG